MSDNAQSTGYSRSLFERFLAAGLPSFMLSIQYRMHSSIRKFPSEYFYDGKLHDSDSIKSRKLEKGL